MNAGSGLASGAEALPELAARAVAEALEQAGLERANSVLLFLSSHFDRQPQPAVVAAARAAGCLAVTGMTAPGVFTERAWSLDQPTAAALVLGGPYALAGARPESDLTLVLSDLTVMPSHWQGGNRRLGPLAPEAKLWDHGRAAAAGKVECAIGGSRATTLVAPGLRPLAGIEIVDGVRGHDLLQVGHFSAVESLVRALPPELRDERPLPVHRLAVLRDGQPDSPAIPLLSINQDGSITLAQQLQVGDSLAWSLRQSLAQESDWQQRLEAAVANHGQPDFAVAFACIGRGPLADGGEYRDMQTWRRHCPDVPLIGAHVSGQVGPGLRDHQPANLQWQNALAAALFQEAHV